MKRSKIVDRLSEIYRNALAVQADEEGYPIEDNPEAWVVGNNPEPWIARAKWCDTKRMRIENLHHEFLQTGYVCRAWGMFITGKIRNPHDIQTVRQWDRAFESMIANLKRNADSFRELAAID